MILRVFPMVVLFLSLLSACAAPAPTWRVKATALVDGLVQQDVLSIFPQEYNNLLETFEHGEAVLHVQGDEKEADDFYLLAIQKGTVLKGELLRRRQLQEDEKKRRAAEEAARIDEERLMIQAAEAEDKLRKQQQLKAIQEKQQAAAAKLESAPKELPAVYTVRRGETLPQIAARSEIYNDASLWPLIYRSNRDQIRNPKQLWPGQSLKIPRHFSRDEAIEAKRFSGKK